MRDQDKDAALASRILLSMGRRMYRSAYFRLVKVTTHFI